MLKSLFNFNPETLFFVNDQQAEISEANVFRNQAVCANDQIDLSVLQFFNDFFLLTFRLES